MAAEGGEPDQDTSRQRCGPKPKELNPWMELSAGISDHPMMRELNGHLERHLPEPSGANDSRRDSLRGGGSDVVDKRMKELATRREKPGLRGTAGDASVPMTPAKLLSQVRSHSCSPAASPTGTFQLTQLEKTPVPSPTGAASSTAMGETAAQRLEAARSSVDLLDRVSTVKTRHKYQTRTDKTLKRLFVDMELARDERQNEYGHKTRCEHLDKVFDWYDKSIHVLKDDRKERKQPPYLVFSKDEPVSPGSMRVQRVTRPSPLLKAYEMGQSSSSPALLVDPAVGSDS